MLNTLDAVFLYRDRQRDPLVAKNYPNINGRQLNCKMVEKEFGI